MIRIAAVLCAALAAAGEPYRNPDNPNPKDPWEGTYPVPYHRVKVPEIADCLGRIRAFLDTEVPTRIVNAKTGAPISDLSRPDPDAVVDRGGEKDLYVLDYPMGVIDSGMLLAGEVTGDKRYAQYVAKHLAFIAESLPYFRAQAEKYGAKANSFRPILAPASLDDCGAMTAALIRAKRAGVGPDLGAVISKWSDYIAHGQFRMPDGTLARKRPQPVSLWADDLYMGIPALAEMGRMTGDAKWLDDAAWNAVQLSVRLFDPPSGLYQHGWNQDDPDGPGVHWARANGWAMLALCDLLDELPASHRYRAPILGVLRAHINGVAALQSGTGLWHQVLDRDDSYLETSASAIFTYCIAHAVNQGWVSPVSYGPVAHAGWIGVSGQVGPKGEVENTCVATTFAPDMIYYYNRPVSVYAPHGYGPVLLAGSEMIKLLTNPAFEIQYSNRTYNFVPKE